MDARFLVRGTDRSSADRALVVAVDPATLRRYRNHYPLQRHLYADAARRLQLDGARKVAIDVQFTERSTLAEDNALVSGLRKAPGTILVATEVGPSGSTAVLGGPDAQSYARVNVAGALLPLDDGGTYRRFDFAQSGLPTLPLVASGRKPSSLGKAPAWIDFPGGPGTVPAVSMSSLLDNRISPSVVRGRYVVLGVTAPTVQDVHSYSTLAGRQMTGAEIEADAILTAVDGAPLRNIPGWLGVLLTIGLAGGTPLLIVRPRPLAGAAAALGLAAVFAVVSQLTFDEGHVLPLAAPLVAMGISAALALATAYALLLRVRAAEIRAARMRAVQAADEARHRIERDLHDGAQQRLLALAMRLGAQPGTTADDGLIADAVGQLKTTVEELRDLSRGLAPRTLEVEGLAPALLSLAAQSPLPVHVAASGLPRLPAEVERTAYFVCAEGLANVIKHARAGGVWITATVDGRALALEVRDDGAGGADAGGSGVAGLAERVAALGGQFDVVSPLGGGTTLTASLPTTGQADGA